MRRAKYLYLGFLIFFPYLSCFSQEDPEKSEKNRIIELRIELLAESLEAEDLDFTTLFNDLSYFFEHPINLNHTSREELEQLYLLNDIQINNLISHMQRTGRLLSIYELQGIDGFDLPTIRLILPFVEVRTSADAYRFSLKELKKNGSHELLLRQIRILEEQEGFRSIEDSLLEENPNRRYLGDPNRLYTRYRFTYGNRISAGFTAEKDPGEEFFSGTQKNGFDFYSAHIYLHRIGRIKNLALGDYQVQLGQGLAFWSGLAFGKSADAIGIKRNARGIRPYTSVDENLFMRGGAATIGFGKKLEVTAFYSTKDVDANITPPDTLDPEQTVTFTSLQFTGFHRTPGEIEDKDAIREQHAGTHITYNTGAFSLGATGVYSALEGSRNRNTQPYNQFEWNDNSNYNLSLDYDYIFRNFNFFGEVAVSDGGGYAYTNGLIASLSSQIELSISNRNFRPDYQTAYSNAFSEGTRTINEQGTYLGVVIRPTRKIAFSSYYDQFTFPWLRFSTDAPSKGWEYLGQLNYQFSRSISMYLRYRREDKERNGDRTIELISPLRTQVRENIRYHVAYKLNNQFYFKSRVEFSKYRLHNGIENGYLIYQDVQYKHKTIPITLTGRYALFETDSYDARIYAYENDILYLFTVPAYAGRGSRFYLLAKYRFSRHIDLWLRLARTVFDDRDVISSGLNEIDGNTRTEFKAQLRFRF